MTIEAIDQVFGFGIGLETQLFLCEVVMLDCCYQVLFNGKNVAKLEMDDDMDWVQSSGTPIYQTLVAEIGWRIENKYM